MSLWRRVFQEQRAVVLPLVILVVANIGVLVLGVLPLKTSVAGLKDERLAAAMNLSRAKLLERQAKDARASKERADEELKKFYAGILPTDFQTARTLVISFLQRTANQSGLVYRRSQADQVDVKESQLQRLTGKVTLSGDYNNIKKFLFAVETAPEFVIVERVALAQASDLKSSNTGVLEVTLDVTTYYLGGGGQ